MFKFVTNIAKKFYHDETLVDVHIDESEVKEFIKSNNELIEILSSVHLKKIEEHKNRVNDA